MLNVINSWILKTSFYLIYLSFNSCIFFFFFIIIIILLFLLLWDIVMNINNDFDGTFCCCPARGGYWLRPGKWSIIFGAHIIMVLLPCWDPRHACTHYFGCGSVKGQPGDWLRDICHLFHLGFSSAVYFVVVLTPKRPIKSTITRDHVIKYHMTENARRIGFLVKLFVPVHLCREKGWKLTTHWQLYALKLDISILL